MVITLPSARNQPPNDLSTFAILIAGPKKIGKTSLAAAAGKDPFIIQGEPKNSIALPYKQLDILSWLDFKQVYTLLTGQPNYCDIKIVDDVPSFYNLCFNHICKEKAMDHPQDLAYGKGWKFVSNEFETVMKRFQGLSGGIIYTAHTEMKEFEKRNGGKFNRLETTMTGQADKLLDAIVQIWMVMDYNKQGERIIIVRGDDFIKAGQGIPGRFLYPDGSEIKEIPLGNSPQIGWSNIVKGFNNELEKPKTQTTVAVKTSLPQTETKKPGLRLGKG